MTEEYRSAEGAVCGAQVRASGLDELEHNDWLAANQFAVLECTRSRRLHIVLFVNFLLVTVLDVKYAASEDATIWNGFQQPQTRQAVVPVLVSPNARLADNQVPA